MGERKSEHGWCKMAEYHLIGSRSLHVGRYPATITHGPSGGLAKQGSSTSRKIDCISRMQALNSEIFPLSDIRLEGKTDEARRKKELTSTNDLGSKISRSQK